MLMSAHVSRKKCKRDNSITNFNLSLGDYRNNLFTSNNPIDIMNFYDSFESRDELIEWMKERPKGAANIHEVEGDKDIIIVIPTADFNGKYARECREITFRGLHMIFVESGEIPDPYFNYAHNVNLGIMKAIEYDPEWVIVSNDDVYGIDNISTLVQELSTMPADRSKSVFVSKTRYHSYSANLAIARIWRNILFSVLGKLRRFQLSLERRYRVHHFLAPSVVYYSLFFKREKPSVRGIGNFGIFSGHFAGELNGILFDETYINGGEDLDLSLRISSRYYTSVNWKLGDFYGSTLGKNTPEGVANLKGTTRRLRDVANMAYFNYKLDSGFFTQSVGNNEGTGGKTK